MNRVSVLRDHLSQDERGLAMVEYVIVLLVVTLPIALAIAAIGPPLVAYFEIRVMWLSLPIP